MLLCCLLHFLTCVILVSNKMKVLLTSTYNVTNRGLETAVSLHCISPVSSLQGKMFLNQIQGSNRSEDGGPRRQLSTSETSKKLNQSEFLERSVRIMKLSLSFDPYPDFVALYPNTWTLLHAELASKALESDCFLFSDHFSGIVLYIYISIISILGEHLTFFRVKWM